MDSPNPRGSGRMARVPGRTAARYPYAAPPPSKKKRAPLGYAPLPTDLGRQIGTEVCQPCWAEWLQTQTRIINHYGLDLTSPEAQGFLMDNMKGFFYGANEELAQIDTSKEGSIKW